MTDTHRETPAERAEDACGYLFRAQAKRRIGRWWRLRHDAACAPAALAEAAGDVFALLTMPQHYPYGRPAVHPYAKRQLGDPMRLPDGTFSRVADVARLARADAAKAQAPAATPPRARR